jgi:hypothetical protein
MSCNLIDLDPVYIAAAAGGSPLAQSRLALHLGNKSKDYADSDPAAANELLAMAEVFARLGAMSGDPSSVAALGTVFFFRALVLCDSDPVRSLSFAEAGTELFDWVTEYGDADGREAVAHALVMFAEVLGDEGASGRLDKVISLLPAERAVLVREWSRENVGAAPAPVREGR